MTNPNQSDTRDILRHLAKLAGVAWDNERLEQIAPAMEGLLPGMRTLMSADVGEAEPAPTFDARPRSGR